MKNNIYQKIVNDIEKEKDDYKQKNLILIKEKIDVLLKLDDIKITDEDILIVLSDIEDELRSKKLKISDNELIEKLDSLILYIDEYFKTNEYNGDLVLKRRLSNGLYYYQISQELILYDKAISLKNNFANSMKILAFIVMVFSVVSSIAMFNEFTNNWFELLISGLLFSLVLLSISEIIQIIHDIRRKIYKKN